MIFVSFSNKDRHRYDKNHKLGKIITLFLPDTFIEIMEKIIKSSLDKSMSYQAYRDLMIELVENNSTTGNDKSEAMAEYTKLNDRRMKRWDKTIKISEEAKETFSNLDAKQTWLVITESWCGDAAHVVPVMNKLAELNENINFKVVLRDDNDALMNQFLTNGGKAIPKLIMLDETSNKVINSFGPRPAEATQMVVDYKAKHGKITPEFKEELQLWYNKDKGQSVVKDLVKMQAVTV